MNGGAGARPAFESALPANVGQAPFHVRQSVPLDTGLRIKPPAIVLDGDVQLTVGKCDAHGDFRGLRVLDDIVNGLFHRHADIVPGLAGQLDFSWKTRYLKAASQWSLLAQFICELGKVGAKCFQIIVLRAYRPDGLIKCRYQFARHFRDTVEIRPRFFWKSAVVL